MSGSVSVRPAAEQDVDPVFALEQLVPEAPHWPRAVYAEMVAAGVPARRSAEGRFRRLLVAEAAPGEILGFAVVAAVLRLAAPANLPAELESIAVAQSARRRGAGRALCRAAMGWAQTQGAPALELEVRATNPSAQALYRSLGFAQTGVRRNYYSEPADDAVLMSIDLHSGT